MTKQKKQKPKLDELEQQIAELDNKWKRALADYQNLEKRVNSQQTMYAKLANVELIDKLLPIVDDLERAAEHIKDDGVGMILKQFHSVLESEGVAKIEAEGAEFDPKLMDCAEMAPGKKNVVMEVLQQGYSLDETVIRPAKVKVGDGSKK